MEQNSKPALDKHYVAQTLSNAGLENNIPACGRQAHCF